MTYGFQMASFFTLNKNYFHANVNDLDRINEQFFHHSSHLIWIAQRVNIKFLRYTKLKMDKEKKREYLGYWTAYECVPCKQRRITMDAAYPYFACPMCNQYMKIIDCNVSEIIILITIETN